MARVAEKQNTFNRGVISEQLHGRIDLELYYTAMADGLNYVVNGRGILEKRPGTMFIEHTKDDGLAELIPFVYSIEQAYMLEFGDLYMRAYANYGQVLSGGVPSETVTPYTAAQVRQLSFTQSNDILFIVHPLHKPARLARTSIDTFALATFDTFDGPYEDMNTNPAWTLALSGTTLTAAGSGFAPFTAAMVGRWVRIRTPNTDSPDPNVLGDEFLWDYMRITAFTSATSVEVDVSATILATADWRLGAFYEGRWPSQVTMHGGRLVLAMRNRIYFSKPYDFNNFSPTQHAVDQIGATGRVLPDNAITLELDSGLSQSGAISEVLWMRSLNFQLLVGTPSGLFSIQSSSLGEGLEPDNAVARFQDARGVSNMRPVNVADNVIFAHATGRRLLGTYYKDGAYDRLGSQDLSLPFDSFVTGAFRQIAWQDYPHGAVWACLADGNLVSLTLQPEEQVQGWMPHRLGGRFNNGGTIEHPHVESVAVIPSPDGRRNDLWMIARRTIDGQNVRFVEVLRPFREIGEDVRNSWYLDAALRYDGNLDPGKTITFSPPGGLTDPNGPWEATTNFADPAFVPQMKLSFFDGARWHRGTIIEVDGNNDFTWQPAAPNAPNGPADGLRWYWVPWENEWQRLPEGELLIDTENNRWLQGATYTPPRRWTAIADWSIAIENFGNLGHLEGEPVRALLDGFPTGMGAVDSGIADFGAEAAVATIGLPYYSMGALLSLEVGAQAGSATLKQRPVYEVDIDIFETHGLEVGTGTISSYYRAWEHFKPLDFMEQLIEGEPPILESGMKRFHRDEQGAQDDPRVAWRHTLPLPNTVRGVLVRMNTSDGR